MSFPPKPKQTIGCDFRKALSTGDTKTDGEVRDGVGAVFAAGNRVVFGSDEVATGDCNE